jgi:hypothetical protein
MSEIVHTVMQCEPIPGTDRTRIILAGPSGSHTFELTPSALDGLLPGLISQAPQRGTDSVAANAISPEGCQPFESRQGLCGIAFKLGERFLHIAVPPNGIEHVRAALDAIAAVYGARSKPPSANN